MKWLRPVGALTLLCALASTADAATFRVGRLQCESSPRVGQIIRSSQSLRCVFAPRRSTRRYVYEGQIRRSGLDIGVTGNGTLSWIVFARNSRIGPSTLRGSYTGASGSVALGLGVGANLLIGGSRRTIVLQPLSVERATGVNLAIGVTSLTLRRRGEHQAAPGEP